MVLSCTVEVDPRKEIKMRDDEKIEVFSNQEGNCFEFLNITWDKPYYQLGDLSIMKVKYLGQKVPINKLLINGSEVEVNENGNYVFARRFYSRGEKIFEIRAINEHDSAVCSTFTKCYIEPDLTTEAEHGRVMFRGIENGINAQIIHSSSIFKMQTKGGIGKVLHGDWKYAVIPDDTSSVVEVVFIWDGGDVKYLYNVESLPEPQVKLVRRGNEVHVKARSVLSTKKEIDCEVKEVQGLEVHNGKVSNIYESGDILTGIEGELYMKEFKCLCPGENEERRIVFVK